jgi:hypothetical protein
MRSIRVRQNKKRRGTKKGRRRLRQKKTKSKRVQ